jgi:uncharacterized protein YbjT (DUF2867 family)
MPSFLITLATGNQGGATAHQLLQAGHQVHAIVRDRTTEAAQALSSQGATLFEGSLTDVAFLTSAAKGVQGIFLNLVVPRPSDSPTLQMDATNAMLEAAAANKDTVTMLVLSTAFHTSKHPVWAAENPNYSCAQYYEAKYAVEQTVLAAAASGVLKHVTILRPAWLMQNNIAPAAARHFPELETERVLATVCLPHTRLPFFDPVDVGKFAVAAFLDPERFSGKEIELGYENLTMQEAAEIMGKVAGVEVKSRTRTDPQEIEEFGKKVPTQVFHVLLNEKDLEIQRGSLDEYGIRLTTFEEFLKREKTALEKALGL